jgi:hypothetical protein
MQRRKQGTKPLPRYRRILQVDGASGQGRNRTGDAAKNDGLMACGSKEAVSAAPAQA